jgi:hypothetical protein
VVTEHFWLVISHSLFGSWLLEFWQTYLVTCDRGNDESYPKKLWSTKLVSHHNFSFKLDILTITWVLCLAWVCSGKTETTVRNESHTPSGDGGGKTSEWLPDFQKKFQFFPTMIWSEWYNNSYTWYAMTLKCKIFCYILTTKKRRGFGPLANYADRATAASWQSNANFCG